MEQTSGMGGSGCTASESGGSAAALASHTASYYHSPCPPRSSVMPHDGGRAISHELDVEAHKAWKAGDVHRALELYDQLLEGVTAFPDNERARIERNRAHAIERMAPRFELYPYDIVCDIAARVGERRQAGAASPSAPGCRGVGRDEGEEKAAAAQPPWPGVTFVVYTCKRYALFVRTMNSFLRACKDLDLITRWICIDDNSHPTERACMRAIFPFFEFVFKGPEDAGHARSVNIAARMIDTPYTLAIEDDWCFVTRTEYVGRALAVLHRECSRSGVRQVLFNRHYAEVPNAPYLACSGGVLRRDAHGRRYLLHEHVDPARQPDAYARYCAAHPTNFAHWPHFALRPSLLVTDVLRLHGGFNEDPACVFELDYARRYHAAGFRSAYFDNITCVHIGRLNHACGDPDAVPNAYQLNDQAQYGRKWHSNRVCADALRGGDDDDDDAAAADAAADAAAASHEPAPRARSDGRVMLTVTTCKRLGLFLRSMCTTLAMCDDVARIARFVVVDDNSSEADRRVMRERLPFFEFVLKTPEQKGHARSMNLILALASGVSGCDWLFHTEDDWDFRSRFSLTQAVGLLRALERPGAHADKGVVQVILRWHEMCTAERRVLTLPAGADHAAGRAHGVFCPPGSATVTYRAHTHDMRDPRVPVFFAEWRRAHMLRSCGADALAQLHARNAEAADRTGGCWWPTLSLNPAVWNVRLMRESGERFDEDMDPTYFEFAISLRLWEKGYGVVMLEHEMSQWASLTAYVLNDTTRLFDANGCENHRHFGGDVRCAFCRVQKARRQPCPAAAPACPDAPAPVVVVAAAEELTPAAAASAAASASASASAAAAAAAAVAGDYADAPRADATTHAAAVSCASHTQPAHPTAHGEGGSHESSSTHGGAVDGRAPMHARPILPHAPGWRMTVRATEEGICVATVSTDPASVSESAAESDDARHPLSHRQPCARRRYDEQDFFSSSASDHHADDALDTPSVMADGDGDADGLHASQRAPSGVVQINT